MPIVTYPADRSSRIQVMLYFSNMTERHKLYNLDSICVTNLDIPYSLKKCRIYSKSFNKYSGLMLAAKKIEFTHPITKEILDFEIDYPDYFTDFLYSNNI